MPHRPRLYAFVICLACCLLLIAPVLHAQDDAAPSPQAATPAPLPTRGARPAPVTTLSGEIVRLELLFNVLRQGQTQLIRVAGLDGTFPALAEITGRFLDRDLNFFAAADGYYALIAAGMEQPTARTNALTVSVLTPGDRSETLEANVEISLGEFIRQNVTLPPTTAYLIDPPTERTEIAQLLSVFAVITPERAWGSSGFALPVATALTSPFGAFRTFNETFNTRHTGWDFRVGLGAPVLASEAGRVVYAGLMPIRGAHVIIDHGLGVYTGYSHLSTWHVTRGQRVTRGQVVGTVGTSGRVSGAHFHWEVAVNGAFVDGAQFVRLWMP